MGKTLLVALLLLLAAISQAYLLNVTVEDGFNTKLVNTQVEALRGPTVAASEFADEHGKVILALDSGPYFIRLTRSGYPVQVLLVNVASDSAMKAVMNNKRETGLLYGRITDAEASWAGKSAHLLADWKIASTANVQPEGYYIFPYVIPGTYSIRLDDGASKLSQDTLELLPKEAVYLDISVVHESVVAPPAVEPTLSAPQSAQAGDLIVATLKAGATPSAGEKITASTPDGTLVLTTDSAGNVALNAVKGGKYIFTYKGQQAMTEIAMPLAPEQNETIEPAAPSAPQEPASPPAAAPGATASSGMEFALLGFVAIALLAIAAGTGLFAYRKIMPPSRIGPAPGERKAEEMPRHEIGKAHHRGRKK